MLALAYFASIYRDPWMGRPLWVFLVIATALFATVLTWDLVDSWNELSSKERWKRFWVIFCV